MLKKEKKYGVVLSLSGGLDSSTLLLRCLNEYKNITCVSFDYGQKHKEELAKAINLVRYLNHMSNRLEGHFPLITHKVIKLDGLSDLLVSGLVDNNSMEMKKGHYAHENALTTVVPNRNAIFASIVYAVALSMYKKIGKPCDIALGTHMGDFDNDKKEGIYPDCSEEFKEALEHAFKIGNWNSEYINYYAPYNSTDKTGVLKDGIEMCEKLKLDYSEVYFNTMTSYNPIFIKTDNPSEDEEDGIWISDFKSGSSVERIESFIKLGLEDPLQYADDDGNLVSWDYVKKYVEDLCKEFESTRKR